MIPYTVFGWTFNQWANAAGVLGQHPKTLGQAAELRRDWLKGNGCAPSDQQVILTPGHTGDIRNMNYEAAASVFAAVPKPHTFERPTR